MARRATFGWTYLRVRQERARGLLSLIHTDRSDGHVLLLRGWRWRIVHVQIRRVERAHRREERLNRRLHVRRHAAAIAMAVHLTADRLRREATATNA